MPGAGFPIPSGHFLYPWEIAQNDNGGQLVGGAIQGR